MATEPVTPAGSTFGLKCCCLNAVMIDDTLGTSTAPISIQRRRQRRGLIRTGPVVRVPGQEDLGAHRRDTGFLNDLLRGPRHRIGERSLTIG